MQDANHRENVNKAVIYVSLMRMRIESSLCKMNFKYFLFDFFSINTFAIQSSF